MSYLPDNYLILNGSNVLGWTTRNLLNRRYRRGLEQEEEEVLIRNFERRGSRSPFKRRRGGEVAEIQISGPTAAASLQTFLERLV